LLDGDRAKACAAAWYSWSILPAIGHFVIRVGVAVTCVASLTCPTGRWTMPTG
jgi:hypothetical protein